MKHLSLYHQEQLRTLRQKTAIFIVLAVLLCTFVLCWLVDHQANEDGYSLPVYAYISNIVLELPENQQEAYLTRLLQLAQMQLTSRWTDADAKAAYAAMVEEGTLPEDMLALTEYQAAAKAVLADLQGVTGYDDYIQKIQKQSKRIQILFRSSPNVGYQESNVIKTAQDYEPLLSVRPVFEQNAGIKLLDNLTVGAYLLTIGTLLLSLIINIGDHSYFSLFRSTKRGRVSVTFAKISVLLFLSTVMAIGVSAVVLIYAGARYGFGDLARPIQSVSSMCPWKISVGQYLLALVGWTVMAQWVMVMLCSFLCILFRHAVPVTCGLIAILMLGALLHHYVPAYTLAGALKYLNPFALLNGQTFLREYHNLNLFAVPIGLTPCTLIWFFTMMALLMVFCLLLAKGNGAALKLRVRHPVLYRTNRENHYSTSLLAREAWHFFIGQKALLLCLAVIVTLVVRGSFFPLTLSPYEQYRRTLIEQALQQDDASAWITNEYEKEITQNAGADSLRERALADIMQQCASLDSLDNPNAVLLFDSGYKQLLGGTVNAEGTLIVAVAITFLSMLTAREDIDGMLQTLPRNRRSRQYQALLKFCAVLFLFVVVLCADIVRVQQTYSMSNFSASAASVLSWKKYEALSLFTYLVITQFLRLSTFLLFALFLFTLSRCGYLLPLAVSLFLVIFPLVCVWVAPSLAISLLTNELFMGQFLM